MPGYCGYFSNRFLSTPSARRATLPRGGKFRHRRHFYPRPPRGGRPRTCWIFCYRWYFYPRPPRGGRHIFSKTLTGVLIFLSTPSARRATGFSSMYLSIASYFYPRPPRGGRPLDSWHYGDNYTISIHALREEGDIDVHVTVIHDRISIHALREEGDRSWSTLTRCPSNFYPRPPRGGRLSSCRLSGVQS